MGGYAYERVQLLTALQNADVDHLVFLSTDTHAAFANRVRYRTLPDDVAPENAPPQPRNTPYMDFTIGPVASESFGDEIDRVTSRPGNGQLVAQAFFKPPPPNGTGMDCAQLDQNSYAEVMVKRGTLSVEYKQADGSPVTDVDGTPCGPYVLTH